MFNRKIISTLLAILAAVTFAIGGLATYLLYQTAFDEESARLREVAQSQARLLEAVARFDANYSSDYPGGSFEATLSQMREAHSNYRGFGKSGEFTLAKQEEGQIVFLLSHRFHDMNNPNPVPVDSPLAEAMRRALKGESGVMVGFDYRGERVLAAYEPVKILELGIVAKIDLTEIRAPFITAFAQLTLIGLLLIAAAALLFHRVTDPLLRELRNSEIRFRSTFDQAAVGIAHVGLDGSWLRVNDKLCRILGYRREELLGMTFQDITHPADLKTDLTHVQQLVDGHDSAYAMEKRYLCKDGGEVWAELTVALVRNDDGTPAYFISVIEDISARKAAELALQASEKTFRLAMNAVQDGLWDWNVASGEVVYSPAWRRILGEHEIPNEYQSWESRIHPDDKEPILASLQEHLAGNTEHWQGEHRLLDYRGNWIWVLGRGSVVTRDDNGAPLRMVGTMSDISERKRDEAAIRQAEERFRLLLNSAAEGIYGIDTRGNCIFANRASLEMLGYQAEEDLIGRNMHELMHHSLPNGSHYPQSECLIYRAFRLGEKTHIRDEVFWRRDGSAFPVEYWSYPIQRQGKLDGAVVTFFDITERQRAETERETLLNDMGERMKELRCLFNLTEVIRQDSELDVMLRDAASILPLGWQFTKDAVVRIVLDGEIYANGNCEPTEWKLSSDLHFGGKSRGKIEVYYTRAFPEAYEGPFLHQERELLDSIAQILGAAIQQHEAERLLEHMATHDPLTGLFNRNVLEQRLRDEISRALRYGHKLSLLMLDIDHFKRINDTHGHPVGDQVLRELSGILENTARKTDIAARYGGEEFVVILPETGLSMARETGERLRRNIAAHPVRLADGTQLHITASIGIATLPEHADSQHQLLQAADEALYAAKEAGRDRVMSPND